MESIIMASTLQPCQVWPRKSQDVLSFQANIVSLVNPLHQSWLESVQVWFFCMCIYIWEHWNSWHPSSYWTSLNPPHLSQPCQLQPRFKHWTVSWVKLSYQSRPEGLQAWFICICIYIEEHWTSWHPLHWSQPCVLWHRNNHNYQFVQSTIYSGLSAGTLILIIT